MKFGTQSAIAFLSANDTKVRAPKGTNRRD